MHVAKPILIYALDSAQNPLHSIDSRQAKYVSGFLNGLDAKVVFEEQNYFDRDYLSEFAAFYSQSSKGYPNICRRLHFFSDDGIDRDVFEEALGDCADSKQRMQESYLGFIILRPIEAAPLGRTALKWFPDPDNVNPRVTTPSRRYRSDLTP